MAQSSPDTISLALELFEALVNSGLPPEIARLYSHHTRLRENQLGLPSWRRTESRERLHDVVRLLEVSSIQKEINDNQWQKTVCRAGEILEWLPSSDVDDNEVSTKLLAAACYQLAGYPARALGLLRENNEQSIESRVLTALLRADLGELFQQIQAYWSQNIISPTNDSQEAISNVEDMIVRETISALGLLCAVIRWGHDDRIQKALDKLTAISKVVLNGNNPFSWLLSKLCAEVAAIYVENSMRQHIDTLIQAANLNGRAVFERYLRQSFQDNRSMVWPSQAQGILQLASGGSFALCTPTGSGKTTVAELAILQSLFLPNNERSGAVPLVIYLVPSRALATEVESKLDRVLKRSATGNQQVTVTGLYGGTDWGPTDAWLTSEERTVLICTYEKAEALMKFLGSFFLPRTTLVVIDEAHTVQFNGTRESLQKSENRSLRLESLGARLLSYVQRDRCRIVALSAVAAEAENALARWVSQQSNALPVRTDYKSTRKLIGRLECQPGGNFSIRYDLLDGKQLTFGEGNNAERPYVPSPFPTYPPVPQKFMRGSFANKARPYLLWAAMHLAAPDAQGQQRAVLISISQRIGGYARDFIELLQRRWSNDQKPLFFQEPIEPQKQAIWHRCLESCADYYGTNSREYKLLREGIVVHHGRMPGLLARLMVEVIDQKIVHLVMATSTLSEGVNLPFETVLIPSLQRWNPISRRPTGMSSKEFNNLVGRAGRPGFGTEGRSLVLLPERPVSRAERDIRNLYFSSVDTLSNQQQNITDAAVSPLSELITHLRRQWGNLVSHGNNEDFLVWLEQTAPISTQSENQNEENALESLDALDHILLGAIVEVEQLSGHEMEPAELEEELQSIWQQSYAYYASQTQAQLQEVFLRRGIAIKTSIYANYGERRRLYKTSLPPRSGNQLLIQYQSIRNHLETGENYLSQTEDQKFSYIQATVSSLSTVSSFSISNMRGARSSPETAWESILRWWLSHVNAPEQPRETQISNWHKFVNDNFIYRFNWGMGSILALAMEEAFGEVPFEPSSLDTWPQLHLPWIVFWMKELIIWGTLDPVAAYLLARIDGVSTRTQAEELAQGYYRSVSNMEADDQLNPVLIRNWSQQAFSSLEQAAPDHRSPREMSVTLLRNFNNTSRQEWRVIPVAKEQQLYWVDPAGFPLAACTIPENWQLDFLRRYDFKLNSQTQVVTSELYL